jgi:hypothetical protein
VESDIKKKIAELKKDLSEKKEEILAINELAMEDIDKKSAPIPLEKLSDRELESLLDNHHARLAKSVDPLSVKIDVTSPRKLLGKPVTWFKQRLLNFFHAYITPKMEKQTAFNQTCVELFQAMIHHQKKLGEKILQLEDKVNECESHLAIMSDKIKDLEAKLDSKN